VGEEHVKSTLHCQPLMYVQVPAATCNAVQAEAVVGGRFSVATEMMLRLLQLEHAADTAVGERCALQAGGFLSQQVQVVQIPIQACCYAQGAPSCVASAAGSASG
jgi:hypothetical protein